MLGTELRDASGGRDRTMAELYRARQEAEDLRAHLTEAQEECRHAQNQLDRMRSQASQEVVTTTNCPLLFLFDCEDLLTMTQCDL